MTRADSDMSTDDDLDDDGYFDSDDGADTETAAPIASKAPLRYAKTAANNNMTVTKSPMKTPLSATVTTISEPQNAAPTLSAVGDAARGGSRASSSHIQRDCLEPDTIGELGQRLRERTENALKRDAESAKRTEALTEELVK